VKPSRYAEALQGKKLGKRRIGHHWKDLLFEKKRAGDRNRTDMTSLEGWGFTIKLRPHLSNIQAFTQTHAFHNFVTKHLLFSTLNIFVADYNHRKRIKQA
jgi:hypothetical protein